ncbi:Nicotianamine synthase 3 [Fusarium sp. NRRL 25303]|nr:Nicotianamine synthase 3 [Fusarium sp. NRRL 25303]
MTTDSITPGRDLEAEGQVYVKTMVENIKAAKSLCPLDTPEKADQVVPFWDKFYKVIGFTTLDIELETAVLAHPDILGLMPDIRYVMGECEGALEVTWADRVAAAQDATDAWQIFNTTPIHEFYEYVLKAEWSGLLSVMDKAPESIAILGSGAMPETAVWVTNWAKKQAKTVQIHSLELLPERLEKSIKVLDRLCEDTQHCTFEAGDIKDAPRDLRQHDVVYFNAAVGSTTLEKENILLSVLTRMRPGAFVLTRSTHSIKTMAYPVSYVTQVERSEQLITVDTASQDPNSAASEKAATSPHMPVERRAWEEREREFYHF